MEEVARLSRYQDRKGTYTYLMKSVNNSSKTFKPANTLSNGQPLPFLRTSLPPAENKTTASPAKPTWQTAKPSVSTAPQALVGQHPAPKPTWQTTKPSVSTTPQSHVSQHPATAKPASGPVSSTADFAPRPKLERTPRPAGPSETFQVQSGKLATVSDNNNNAQPHTFKVGANGYLEPVSDNNNTAKPHTFKVGANGYLEPVKD